MSAIRRHHTRERESSSSFDYGRISTFVKKNGGIATTSDPASLERLFSYAYENWLFYAVPMNTACNKYFYFKSLFFK